MHSYYVFGLGIHSDLEIPQLVRAEVDPDVIVQFDPTPAELPELDPTHQGYFQVGRSESVFFERRVGLFRVSHGRTVQVQPTAVPNFKLIQAYFVGTILNLLLYQRGILVLHGSAIANENSVVGFVGSSGRGKSSIAAALYARGYRLLSDDAIPIQFRDGVPYVLPGYPQVKISDHVADFLGYDATTRVAIFPEENEASFQAMHRFATEPLPLQRIYQLDPQDQIAISPLSAYDALVTIMRESLPTMVKGSQSSEEFLRCTQLIKAVPFHRLQRSSNLASLPDLAALVEAHSLKSIVKA